MSEKSMFEAGQRESDLFSLAVNTDNAEGANAGKILTSTLWNQSGTIYVSVKGTQTALTGYTYNKFCPTATTSGGDRTLTGCSNTADSQILYYWIEKGYDLALSVSTANYFTLKTTGTTKYYVSDTPNAGEGTLTQLNTLLASSSRIGNGDFIAALNFYCGVNNHSEYGTGATSTTWYYGDYNDGKSLAAFRAAGFDSYHFVSRGYNDSFFDASGLTDLAFSILRENLDYGEPIRVGIPGHAIYMDGYRLNSTTSEYEYHLNYGWGTGSSATTWYTVAQLRTTQTDSMYAYVSYITFDLSPDITVNVTNNRNDYWGGSFLRGVERINSIHNEKTTTFSFDDSIAGQRIELDTTFTVTSSVGLEFQNLKAALSTSANRLVSSSRALSFEIAGGSMTVNSASADSVVYESGNQTVILSMDGGYVYSGNYSAGIAALDSLLTAGTLSYSSLDASFYATVKGNAVFAGNADDQISLANNSAVFGGLTLGGGSNVLRIENGSFFYGGFSAAANSLETELLLSASASGTGPMIVLSDSTSETRFLSAAGSKLNVTVDGSLATDSEYTLYQGVTSTTLENFSVTVSDSWNKYELNSSNLTAGDYTLVYDSAGKMLKLGYNLTAPEVISVSADVTTPTNGDVTLTAVFSDNAKTKYFSFDGKKWQDYNASTGVVLTENGIVYFKAENGNLTSAVSSFTVNWIDKVPPKAPEVSFDNRPTKGNVTVSAVFAADSVKNEYRIGSGTWTAYTGPVVMTDNGLVSFRSTDSVGNVSDTTVPIGNIDRVPPAAPTAQPDTTSPINSDVAVAAKFSADSAQKQYSLDGKSWQAYAKPVVFSQNGTVYFRGIDAAGNISNVTRYDVTNIDKVAPAAPTASADITALTNRNVTVTAKFSADSVQKQYSLDNKSWKAYTSGVVMTANGTVYFRGIDAAGNRSAVISCKVSNIDKTPPVKPVATADIVNAMYSTVTVTAKFSADSAQKQYSLDNRQWTAYTGGITMTANGTVYFRAADSIGNISDVTAYTVSNINGVVNPNPSVVVMYAPQAGQYRLEGTFGTITGTVSLMNGGKTVASGTLTNGVLAFNKGKPVMLDGSLETVLEINAKTRQSDNHYSAVMTPVVLYRPNDGDSASAPVEKGTVSAPGTLIPNGWVGFGDPQDYARFTLAHAANLVLNYTATDATKFVLYNAAGKRVLSSSVKAGGLTTKAKLLEAGTYFLEAQSTNAKKGGSADYTVKVDEATTFFTKGDNSDDTAATAKDLGVISQQGSLDSGWVGYGDVYDYKKITLATAAKLNFRVGAAGAPVKFTVSREVKGKLRSVGNVSVKANTESNSKDLFLEAGTYYLAVQSTTAKRGGSADYAIALNDNTRFYTQGDNSNDNWQAAAQKPAKLAGEVITGWVGFGDASDFIKFHLDGEGQVQLNLNDATANELAAKRIKLTCLDANGKSVAVAFDKNAPSLVFSKKPVGAGDYYLGVTCSNVKKYDSNYSITVGQLAVV